MSHRDCYKIPAPSGPAPAWPAAIAAAASSMRIDELRRAVLAGTYRIDPDRIAGKLLKAR